ncbi:heterokaryon incompatibility 6 OR allele [Fusarium pseudocircinatum]|uniref:Heterokaryon incompatibility 6 OR allele n=1 Tax=Fusarium pseudocircinatum TaxID=56676 RepID=A0A8H5PFL6_9HYPO|nr:heterokaryon incompatibility 6 OR allele [Fusarium pseudocircinatum]
MCSSLIRNGFVPLLSLSLGTLRATSPVWRIHGHFDIQSFASCSRRGLSYKYDKQLGQDSIRIFTLDPGKQSDELCGTLQTHSIKAAPKYEALSYVWGPPKRTKSIQCNGQDFSITDSLDAALRRLRLPGKPRHIWIDQICIDQGSATERSEQVSIMRHIYSNAEIVNAWLGPADPEVAASAAGIISTLANSKPRLYEKDLFPEDQELLNLGLPTRDSPAWDALNKMLSVPYFSRVWIIQEVAVASDFALLWGDISISKQELKKFRLAALYYKLSDVDIEKGSPGVLWNPVALLYMGHYKVGDDSLLHLVSSTLSTNATDARDKIFALIGLAGDRSYGMVPDYSRSEAEVFSKFACSVIVAENNLNILDHSYVEDPEDPERRPLWAPRWHSDDGSLKHYLNNYHFTASRDIPMVLVPSRNEKILSLRGIQVDSIRAMCDRGNDIHQDIPAIVDMITRKKEVFNKRYGSDIIRTILLTMMAGHESSGPMINNVITRLTNDGYINNFISFALQFTIQSHISRDGRESDQRNYLELVRLAANDISLPVEPCWTSPEDFEFLERMLKTLYPHDPSVIAADLDMLSRIDCDFVMGPQRFEELIQASHGSKIFVTETGYVGFGPRCMTPGDIVCVLFGGGTPYVIRPTGVADEYLFLGPAYVHGLMDGEAIDAWESKRTENHEIQEKLFKLL